jgi:hypothetical protein
MDYKVNIVVGDAQSRPGYIELNGSHISNLNNVLDDGEVTELLALDTIDFLPWPKRGDFLNHLMQKVELGGTLKVGGREVNAVANALSTGQLSIEQGNAILYNGRQSTGTIQETLKLMRFLGLEITSSYYHQFNYIVEARRVV